MRVGVIGCGSIGRRHIGNLLALGCDVHAFDRERAAVERVASEYPAVSTGGFDYQFMKALADECDAAVIATPWDQHLVPVKEALMEHLPLFVEKPLGSLDQIEEWRQIVKDAEGLVTQVGYQLRFHPFVTMVKSLNPTSAFLGSYCDMATWPGKAYGPPLLEMSHEIDLALYLGADEVREFRRNYSRGHTILFGNMAVELDHECKIYERHWRIRCGAAGFEALFSEPEQLGSEMYRAEMEHFLSCVQSGSPTDCPLSDGLKILEVCQQIEALANQPA